MTLLVWPGLLEPQDQRWTPSAGVAVDGGRTLGGARRRSTWQAGGAVRCTLVGIPIFDPEMILLAQALDALMNGGAEPIAVPRRPGRQAPGIVAYAPFSDASTFSDWSDFMGAAPYGALVGAASAWATTITFTWAGQPLLGGEDFSVETLIGPRMHRIAKFDSIEESGGVYTYVAEIRPPLRAALLEGAEINLIDPYCTMYLDNASELAAMLTANLYGFFDAEFVEV